MDQRLNVGLVETGARRCLTYQHCTRAKMACAG